MNDRAFLAELEARDRVRRALGPEAFGRYRELEAKCAAAVNLSCCPPDPHGLRCLTDAELDELDAMQAAYLGDDGSAP
jgi:hypothetical protein